MIDNKLDIKPADGRTLKVADLVNYLQQVPQDRMVMVSCGDSLQPTQLWWDNDRDTVWLVSR